ncbi:MAG: NADH-quinone oxidoreductase subunit NuoN [Betaproteobacteria bacterium]|nr:NADH-quinone oxidoreductase subunit NuoN [Betaproteobacteria bacterium]
MSTLANMNYLVAGPEIALLLLLCIIMLGDLFLKKAGRENILALWAIGAVVLTLLAVAERWPTSTQFAFNNMFVLDQMAALLKVAILLAVGATLVYGRAYLVARNLYTGEFVALLLFATLGMMVMVSAQHFITLYLGLELLSLSSYAMVALNRDSATSTEAAMKYFILGALASGLLLYGVSMVYGATGSLNVTAILNIESFRQANASLLSFGMVFVVAGLAFKLGTVPFHMWIPDVYHGAPTPMTLFIGSASKIAAAGFVLRILGGALQGHLGDWQGMLVIMAVLSIGLGNIVAIAQTNLKRMLAYSTISHMGFLLLGILAGSRGGYAATLFYIVTYALTTLAAFGMILLLSRAGFEAENLDDFKGLNQRSPFYALLMLAAMFSMAGIPPFVGFFAKLSVLEAALHAGYTELVVFAVLMSVIGAFYYLRMVKLMYMDDATDTTPIVASLDMRALLSVNALAILVLGLVPGGLMTACLNAIQRSF